MNTETQPRDDSQRELVRKDITSSMVVEAGAGTGKTTLLIDRIIGLIANFSIRDIAAVTFTEKAAGELIDRLRSKVEEKLLIESSGGISKKMLDVLDEIDTAQISTIHSFARSIVHERAIEAGLDPEFNMIEPDAEAMLVNDIINAELLRNDKARDQWLMRFIHLNGSFEDLRQLVKKLYDNRDLLEDFFKSSDSTELRAVVLQTVKRVSKLADNARQHCFNHADPGRFQILEIDKSKPDVTTNEETEACQWLAKVVTLSPNKGKQENWTNKDICRKQKADLKALKADSEEVIDSLRRETLEHLIGWVIDLTERIDGEKRTLGQIGFQDLLIEARNLLRQPEVRRDLQDRIKRLLIDEFQDTDPLQVEIAMLLASQKADESSAYVHNLEPGKICLVGDPKQSIYRFRRADPDIYGDAVGRVMKTGKKVEITQNFRSSPGIVEFVNVFFEHVWANVNTEETPYRSITPDPARPVSQPSPSVAIVYPSDSWDPGSVRVEEIREAEANAIAVLIKQAHSDPDWKVYDKDDRKFISPRWNDFAILFQTVTGIDIYADALNRCGIPFQVEGGKRFFQQPIIEHLYSTLAAVDNPADTLNLIAALRSEFFGIPDRELMLWRQSTSGELDYRRVSIEQPENLKAATELLCNLHTKRKSLRVEDIIAELFEKTAARLVIRSDRETWIDEAAIDRVLAHARKWSNEHGFGLRGFTRWFKNRIEQKDDKGSGQLADNTGVRLMTIHSAKGLEFPVVLLANMSGGGYRAGQVIANRLEKKLEISIGSNERGFFKSRGYDLASEQEERADLSERMRLLYVAMTRSRDHLVLPMFYREDAKGIPKGLWYQWLVKFFTEVGATESKNGKLWRLITIPADRGTVSDGSVQHAEIEGAESVWDDMKAWESERLVLLSKAIEKLPKKFRPSDQKEDITRDEALLRKSIVDDGIAIRIGSALHSYMALSDMTSGVDTELMAYIAEENGVSVGELEPLVKSCLASDVWLEACRAKRVWREAPVAADFKDGLMRGIIDLVWEDAQKKIHIVDYKTGQKDVESHLKQVKLYQTALCKILSQGIASTRLYYVSTGETVFLENGS